MAETIFRNKKIREILEYYKLPWALSYAAGIAHWDLETYMPERGAGMRGEALAKISSLRQNIFLDPAFAKLLASAGKQEFNDYERGVVRILLRTLKFYERLPKDFIEEFEKLTSTATVVWRTAKENNDFKLFAPYLSRIFDMNRQMAEYLRYSKSPYDALLDQYEEGLTSNSVNQLFSKVRGPLKELLDKITHSKKYFKVHPLENAKYNQNELSEINNKILRLFWSDFGKNFRVDTSAHPFTTSFANTDTRITTWYHDHDFARSILATVHEFGHALYDLQCDPNLQMTPIQGGSSLVVHESQSRFWENFVGRSEEFIKYFRMDFESLSPEIKNILRHDVQGTTLYMYFNKVSPSMLRVEADEVTYHFHIMLRYEIEKEMIEGKIKTKDLPEIWNAKMKEYLGITPKTDSEGVLQDIHWSGGSVGYFPTYSLGTFLGAQWEEKTRQGVKGKSLKEDTTQIEQWLKEHVHKYGSTYTLQDLLKKNKMKFDPSVNLKYLNDKYSKIYGF